MSSYTSRRPRASRNQVADIVIQKLLRGWSTPPLKVFGHVRVYVKIWSISSVPQGEGEPLKLEASSMIESHDATRFHAESSNG